MASVPRPQAGQEVEAVWGTGVAEAVIQRFVDASERDAFWTAPPIGAVCAAGEELQEFTRDGWTSLNKAYGFSYRPERAMDHPGQRTDEGSVRQRLLGGMDDARWTTERRPGTRSSATRLGSTC